MSNIIQKGNIIEGKFWPEPVEVKLIEETGQYYRIVGETKESHRHIDQLITKDDLRQINVLSSESKFSEEPWKVFLALEAKRYRYASLYDPLLAMNTSKVDPVPHQIEAVYGYILNLPRIRFLIADDPGAGKTIMAGLVIKELKLRHQAKKIMIVSPGHLIDQWHRELKERFDEYFNVVNRGILDAFYGENPWDRENQIITSIDFAKRDDVLPGLSSAPFDLIIVDEAHKMSAYRYSDKTKKTKRYRLGEALSRITEHMLFLTATPHKGDQENFQLFLDLLEPGFFATTEMLNDSIENKDNPLFIRRVKEDLKNFKGEPIFLPRHVETRAYELGSESPKEKELYNQLSKYVKNQYNRALSKNKKRNITFALIILQRRLASSTYALLRSLERRQKRLEKFLEGPEKERDNNIFNLETVEDLQEEERWKIEEIWETLSVAENREQLNKEIKTIENLMMKAEEIIEVQKEVKLRELRNALTELSNKFQDPKDKKIVIFTESKDTLRYLEERIREWGYSVNTIHGGMKIDERVKAEQIFRNETQIMIATEAAGEGINLQFCHLMINYDIPWNPNRLEQRMGRIHRYGQTKEVYVVNLVAGDTREGKVLSRLFQKLEEISIALGTDKVFDCIGEVLSDKNLADMLSDAASNARNLDDILKNLDIEVNEEYISGVKDNLGESLAVHYIDYTRIKEMEQEAREHRLIPEYTENFFLKAFTKAGGKLKKKKDGSVGTGPIPFEIRKIAEEEDFRRSYGEILKKGYRSITFDKEQAFKDSSLEFISFGHPLFEAVMIWIEKNFSTLLLNGSSFIDPDGKLDGYILFYEGEIKDGRGNTAGKRLFSYFITDDDAESIPPSILWDLEEAKDYEINDPGISLDSLKSRITTQVVSDLEAYKAEIFKERDRQTKIKEKYGIRSLNHLILKLDGDLIDLNERKERGENVEIVIINKQQRKNEYEKSLAELTKMLGKEKSLSINMPRFVGIINVSPPEKVNPAMKSDKEIELKAMEEVMKHERSMNRTPEDVSVQNLGFDIRSKDEEGNVRYIEVKGRAHFSDVALTQNEWFKAQRFNDEYFLYAVLNVSKDPKLFIIQNPSKRVELKKRIEVVRYIIPHEEIEEKGDSVEYG